MKINSKILSIPPHISTSWDNVSGIFMDSSATVLVISLKNGQSVSIPGLDKNVLQEVFTAHAEYLEQSAPNEALPDTILSNLKDAFQFPGDQHPPINLENLGSFTGMMQHDPSQKNAADLPKEILDRVSQVAKALGLDKDSFDAPEGQPHCNCPYCQIARALVGATTKNVAPIDSTEEVVQDIELKFREWDINQVADKLYEINNPLDKSERYQVYLGQPIGCTCGKNNCEHIIAVLNS